jgi:NAD(P)-dependent dehydrogenase (short-subunit alcohol dehydrogenase family)
LTGIAPISAPQPTAGGLASASWAIVTLPGYGRKPGMPNLEGKVALITGGARGFGRAIARALASDGADIAIADIAGELPSERIRGLSTRDDLERTRAEVEALGRRCIAIRANVSHAGDCERMAATVVQEFGRVDILAANAGVFSFGLSWELTEDDWDTVLGVNLKGADSSHRRNTVTDVRGS